MANDIFNVVDFLPKYPNINNDPSLPSYMSPYEETFEQSILEKKEFFDLRLEKREEPKKGEFLSHQKIIARFMSQHTMYDGILMVHEMGTGKTCAAFAAIESIKKAGGPYKGALILAKSPTVIKNLKNELVYVCTNGQYIPENVLGLTEIERNRRITKLTNEFYTFMTFDSIQKTLQHMPIEKLIREYSNMIILIDEAHHLSDTRGSKIYKEIKKLFHNVRSSKKILMSGTPMTDTPDEIASLLNLILPVSQNLPTGKSFVEEYLVENKDTGIFDVADDKKDILKQLMRGRVSFLKTMKSDIEVVYEGEPIDSLRYIKVVPSVMDKFQLGTYRDAYNKDTHTTERATDNDEESDADESGGKTKGSGIYSKSRQATLFVFPDGTFGREGFERNIVRIDSKSFFGAETVTTYQMNRTLKGYFSGTQDEILEKIKKCSAVYGSIIEDILGSVDRSYFIYDNFVKGSGCIVLSLLLELFGFKKATGKEVSEGKRYAVLTNETSTAEQISSVIRTFNTPNNMTGSIIKIVIGSRKMSEGITLKNVQGIHIATPHWNYSELSQAIGRGLRFRSHEALIDSGINPVVRVYQHVAVTSGVDSIDLKMYKLCENKDVSIKKIERLIKEASFDCALFYDRNRSDTSIDGTRDCEYQECDYSCVGIDARKEIVLDYSTYNLYYSDKVQEIVEIVRGLFRSKFVYKLDEIVDIVSISGYSRYQIIYALKIIIYKNITLKNKYGFASYLRENSNILFIVNSISEGSEYSVFSYSKDPVVLDKSDYDSLLIDMTINKISSSKTVEDFVFYIDKLPDAYQISFIQTGLLASQKGSASMLINFILQTFTSGGDKNKYTFKKNDYVLENGHWVFVKKLQDVAVGVESPYNYAGVLNDEKNIFCIRKKETDKSTIRDTRGINVGKVCLSWKKPDLQKVADDLGIEYDESYKSKQFCDNIQKFFSDKELMEKSPFCGVQGGKKK